MSRRLAVALLLGLAASAPAARLHFDESMTGPMGFVGAPQGAAAQVTLRLRLATDDTNAFFADPTHPMAITGWLDVRPAEGETTSYPVDEGAFYFLAPGSDEDERVMIYSLRVTSASGRSFWFEGVKTLDLAGRRRQRRHRRHHAPVQHPAPRRRRRPRRGLG
jgi:hypothetical protein